MDERLTMLTQLLTPRQILVLSATYFDRKTQEEIAVTLGVTQERVCQIAKEAMALLKAAKCPLPTIPKIKTRTLSCPHEFLDALTKQPNGTFKIVKKRPDPRDSSGDDFRYEPYR